jgi:Ser/Thr protein kinase RdoA (MazF antagonist)
MRLIKEPIDIDFYIETRPLTNEDEKAIHDFIQADKQKYKVSIKSKQKTQKSSKIDKNIETV